MAHRLEPSFEINNGMVVNSLKYVEILLPAEWHAYDEFQLNRERRS
jgi:hypothetical protein